MEVYKLLHEDHERIYALFSGLEETTEGDIEKRETLIRKLELEYTVHCEAEERYFYPRLLSPADTRELAHVAREEHLETKALLTELAVDPKGTAAWTAQCAALRERVERHFREEEGPMFTAAMKVLSEQDARSIGERIEAYQSHNPFRAAWAEAPEGEDALHPSANTPENASEK